MGLSPSAGISSARISRGAGIGGAGLAGIGGASPPPPPPSSLSASYFTDTGTPLTTIPSALRVRINGGAWQTPAAAGFTGFSVDATTRELVLTGGPSGVTSLDVHYEQEQPGEPYDIPPVTGTWLLLDGQPAMVNPAAYGIPLAPTHHTAPVSVGVS